jgi:hypothetical protein
MDLKGIQLENMECTHLAQIKIQKWLDYGPLDSILPRKSFTSCADILFSEQTVLYRIGPSDIYTYIQTYMYVFMHYYYHSSTTLCWAVAAFSVLLSYTQSVGLLERRISQSHGFYTHRINVRNTDIHALSGIRAHNPSVRIREENSCLRPRAHFERHIHTYIYTYILTYTHT